MAGTDLKPRYVYSHKETVWAADGALELLPNPIMDLNEKQILSGFQEVRALAVHVADNFVYMDDVVTDVLSRSSVQGEGLIEITVNTRQVEGHYYLTIIIELQVELLMSFAVTQLNTEEMG